jgi:hypothetical protein
MSDAVRDYLRNRGCAQHVVEGGLEGLIEGWEKTVASIVEGYPLGLEDYLNDMDGRQLLEDVMPIISAAKKRKYGERIRRADERVRKVVRRRRHCLWSEETAAEQGWTPEKNWWYFSEPITAAPELLEDLKQISR